MISKTRELAPSTTYVVRTQTSTTRRQRCLAHPSSQRSATRSSLLGSSLCAKFVVFRQVAHARQTDLQHRHPPLRYTAEVRELRMARRTTRPFYEGQIVTSETQLAVIFGRRVVVGPPNVSNFLFQHPGGEWVISTFAEKDTTTEFDMIHPPDVVEKNAPGATTGSLGEGGEDDDDEEDGSSVMAKRNKKGDVWEVLNGRVLNVSIFLSQHPDGELTILTFAGKDATAEFDVIQPPYVVEKYAPGAIIGVVGSGKAKKAESWEVGSCCDRQG